MQTQKSKRKKCVEMADSSPHMQSLKYLHASNVNVSNFVSEKLSSDDNYPLWKAQMLCLMESQEMRGIVDSLFDYPGATCFKTVDYDSLLKGWIFGSLTPDVLRTVVHLESAREVWWELQLIYDKEKSSTQDAGSTSLKWFTGIEPQDSLQQFIQIETPAVIRAMVEGRWSKVESILENNKQVATEAITKDGNTMLHLAVGTGQNDFVKQLLDFIDDGEKIEKKNSDGRTALHIAAIVGNTPAVILLVEKRKELLGIPDHKAFVPLHSAYYNKKLETFAYLLEVTEIKGQSHSLDFFPSDYLPSKVNLLITLIFTKKYDLAYKWVYKCPELVTKDDEVLMAIAKTFPSDLSFREALIYPPLINVHKKLINRCSSLYESYEYLYAMAKDILWSKRKSKSTYYMSWLFPEIIIILLVPAVVIYSIYELIFLLFLVLSCAFHALYYLLWKIIATQGGPIERIDKKKRDYINAKEILKLVCDHIDYRWSVSSSNHPCYSGPIVEAVCHGCYEVVNEILVRSPKIIHRKFINSHNIIQLAVINRSDKVYNCICQFIERMDLSIKDSSKNNILHLAGRLAPSFVLSSTTGAAMQLQRELQWRKEVEKFMSITELGEKNIGMETPEMVFTREHKALMKEGENWMKKTAESCSITAALITTIVFAAAITVPGGSNQETGIPLFRNEIAFTIFAVSDAISLFASCTALLVFLSILTAVRFSEQDFLVSLPRRLIIGLCTLILSTIAMTVAFCAILFLMFCDQRAWMLAPISGLACFPVTVVVTLEFPLVVDLFLSTYRPIFLDDCGKSNMKSILNDVERLATRYKEQMDQAKETATTGTYDV